MNIFIRKQKTNLAYRILCGFIAFSFVSTMMVPPQTAQAQMMINLPVPGTMVLTTPGFTPPMIYGLTIHPDNPLMFDFIVGPGDSDLDDEELKTEADRLIKYFLASLTVPENEMWVNLSPYQKERIVPKSFGETEMGREDRKSTRLNSSHT